METSAQVDEVADSPQDDEREEFGVALYDFTAGGDDEVSNGKRS